MIEVKSARQTEVAAASRAAYERYGDAAEWKNYRGDPMPYWEELPEHIRAYWMDAIGPLEFAQFQAESLAQQVRTIRDLDNLETVRVFCISALESVNLPQNLE